MASRSVDRPDRLPTREEEALLPPDERGLGDEGAARDFALDLAREDLREIVAELERLRDRGELTRDAFLVGYDRAKAAASCIDADDHRAELFKPLWAFGALVGCLRE